MARIKPAHSSLRIRELWKLNALSRDLMSNLMTFWRQKCSIICWSFFSISISALRASAGAFQSKKDNDEESIQLSTTPDPGYQMGK